MRRRRAPRPSLTAALVVVALVSSFVARDVRAGLADPSSDVDASDPTASSSRASHFFASEPTLAYSKVHDVVALGYDDEAGAYDVAADGTRTKRAHPSLAGLSLSSDRGRTWTRIGPFPPVDPACTGECTTALMGNPQVASEGARTFYASLSMTHSPPDAAAADAIAVMRSTDGVTFRPPRVVASLAEGIADKYSFTMDNDTALLSYTGARTGALFVSSADGIVATDEPWTPPVRITLPSPDERARIRAPIVRMRDFATAYVAYMIPHDAFDTTFDLAIARLYRLQRVPATAAEPEHLARVDWFAADATFRRPGIAIDPAIPGALGRRWRDVYPISFDVDGISNHLYLAYRELRPQLGHSVIVLQDCDESPVGSCLATKTDGGYDGWRLQEFDDCSAHGGQYQPFVVAGQDARSVAIVFYERLSDDETDLRVTLRGVYSRDSGDHWSDLAALRPVANSWVPCPQARGAPNALHAYGDYLASTILPFPNPDFPPSPKEPWILSAHTDSSGGCVDDPTVTFDQHVQTVLW